MRALVLTGLKQLAVQERPVPEPGPDEVRLEVAACGICGSDVHGFLGEEPRRRPGLCLGHEMVGRIASEHPDFPLGTRVAVNPLMPCYRCDACLDGRTNHCTHKRLIGLDEVQGAFADYTLVDRSAVFPLAEHVSDAEACLLEPLACAVHLMALAPVQPFARTVMFGLGPLGAMTLVVAKGLGYPVTVVEPSAGRREIALAMGADAALAPGELAELGPVFELAVDCTGVTPARRQALAAVPPGSTVLLLGTTDVESTLDFRDMVRRELRLQASYGFTRPDFLRALALLEAGAAQLGPWLTSQPLEAGQAAFESLIPAPEGVVKVLLTPR